MFSAPFGRPTASAARAIQMLLIGSSSGVFTTQVLAVASAAEMPCGHFQRVVPGNDLGRNTERLVDDEIEIVAAKRDRTPFDGFRLIAVMFEIACRAVGLDQSFPIGLA